LGVNFDFEKAPLKLQRAIKSKKKKKTMKRNRREKSRDEP
jgi:hypothetical protein